MVKQDTEQGIGQKRDSEKLPIQPGATTGVDFFGRGRERFIRGLAAAVIVTGTTLAALPFFEKPDNRVEAQLFPSPVPTPEHVQKSQLPFPTPTPTPRPDHIQKDRVSSKETGEVSPNPIYFTDSLGRQRMWAFNNARDGIYPPNDPSIGTGTVYDYIDGVETTAFQPLGSLYPETHVAIAIGGIAADVLLDRYYLGTAFSRDGEYNNVYYPNFEVGSGVNTPDSYTNRVVIKKGLPRKGVYGLNTSNYVILGADVDGNYATYTFTDCFDLTENGIYQIRRDSLGNLIGDTFTKLPDLTPTPTPDPTPTVAPAYTKIYLSLVVNNGQH